YVYERDVNLLRITTRRDLNAEIDAQNARDYTTLALTEGHDALPDGKPIDLDVKDAPLRAVVVTLAAPEHIHVVLPDSGRGRVPVHAQHVQSARLLVAVLQAHGLSFRYRENGRLLRVAPQRDLDEEDRIRINRMQR